MNEQFIKNRYFIIQALLLLRIATTANANLIQNGSFEVDLVTDHNGKWEQFVNMRQLV